MMHEIQEYRKMRKRHRKEMIKLAKEDADYDWSYLHNLVITKIKHMYEYYSTGNNVWQSEESLDVILKTLKHVLDLQEELDKLWDFCDDISYTKKNDDGSTVFCLNDEYTEKLNECAKRENELYEEIYAYIGQNIQWWRD